MDVIYFNIMNYMKVGKLKYLHFYTEFWVHKNMEKFGNYLLISESEKISKCTCYAGLGP